MNKIYRAIWNESTQTWVAASELAKSKTKANTVSCGNNESPVLGKICSNAFKAGLLTSLVNFALLAPNSYAGSGTHSLMGELPLTLPMMVIKMSTLQLLRVMTLTIAVLIM